MFEEAQHNPLIAPEDYFKQYNENIQKLKNHPEVIEFDKLCYDVFETSAGKRFLEYVKRRFFYLSQVLRGAPTYQLDVIWQEGYRDAYRQIMNALQSHEQRIKAEKIFNDRPASNGIEL